MNATERLNKARKNVVQSSGYVPGEQPTDTTTIKLNTNENPYPPSPHVMTAIQSITPEQLRRYPSPSALVFREAAAKLHGLAPDWIMTFNGGDDLLSVIIRTCTTESDAVIFPEPSYSLYPVLTELHGAVITAIRYNIEGVNWSLPANIEQSDAALMLIVNPNAPSGHFNPIARLDQVASSFRGVVLIDEAYVDFSAQSALPLVAKHDNLILLRSMSKGYSLAGLRFGYAIGQPSLLKEIEKVRDSYPCDVVSIAAATAAIQDQEYAASTWQRVKSERSRVSSALRDRGFRLPDSESNFVLAEMPHGSPTTAKQLYLSLKERGLLIRWWDLPLISNMVRITIGTAEQNDRLLLEINELVST
jgi:histidinol-phosphate aminotransferase